MRLRAQPPVHSPIGLAALASGIIAGLGGRRQARDAIDRWLMETYRPAGLLLTDSGTTALHLALRLAVAERPGPVALPAYCCYDIATATDAAGVEFVFYDLDPATLGPDWPSLGRALDRGARVVVAVHLYGTPVDFPAIQTMAAAAGAIVIEDAAQGAGARLGGCAAGSQGRYALLSFGRGKGMTGGRGGALLANEPDAAGRLAQAAGLLRGRAGSATDAAMLLAQWLLARPSLYGLPLGIPSLRLGETIYRAPGPAAEPSSVALGALRGTLRLAAAEADRRRKNARWLLDRIPVQGLVSAPRAPAGTESGFLRLPVVAQQAVLPRFRTTAARFLGIWPGYPKPLSELDGFGARRLDRDEVTPGAGLLADRLFTLPTHGLLDPAGLAALGQVLESVARA